MTDKFSESAVIPSRPRAGYRSRQPNNATGFNYPYDETSDSEPNGLLTYWRFLLRHKGAIALAAILGLLLGFAIGIPLTPIFRARTSIEVLSMNENFMNMKTNSPVTTADYSDEVSEEATQAELLQGDALVRRVSIKLDPDASPVPKKPRMATSGWRSWLHLQEHVVPTAQQLLISRAAKTLKVRVSPRTRILEITTDSTNPQFSATFVNTLVHEFILQTVEARMNSTQVTGDWLKQEIDGARTNLKKSEDALESYARNSGLIFTDREAETNVATEKLQQLQLSLSNATADRISKEARFELAQHSPPQSLADVLNDEGLQTLNDRISAAMLHLADLGAVYTPDYVGVKRARAELTALQNVFNTKRDEIIQKIATDYEQASKNQKMLEAAYVEQAREVAGQDEKTVQYNILKREVDSNRQLYDTMLQQMKQASVASALHASNVRVVDSAVAPDIPVFPNFKLNTVLGLLSGLIISVALLTMRERADRTLHMPGEIKQWTEVQELGTIPLANAVKRRIGYRDTSADSILQVGSAAERSDGRLDPVELITFSQKPSLVAEAFRSALTSILFADENGSRPNVLLFTSAQPGDGKTTVVSNIGIALAEIHKKTLIIDADLRRPRMHQVFGLSNDRGLSDLLREELSESRLAAAVHNTTVPGLDVLPGGPAATAASHLLHSSNFQAYLDQAKQKYDIILIDTPPVIQITDARIIGRISDSVVLVARAGKTTRDALIIANERFHEDRTTVLGSILNAWDPKRELGSYYSAAYRKYHSTYAS